MSTALPLPSPRHLVGSLALVGALLAGLVALAVPAAAVPTGSSVVAPFTSCDQTTTSADLTVVNDEQETVEVLVKMLDPDGGSDGNIDGEVVLVPRFDLAGGQTWVQTLTGLVPGDYRITLNGRRAPDNHNFTVPEPRSCTVTANAVVAPLACDPLTTSADLSVANDTYDSVRIVFKKLDPDGGSDGNIDGEVVLVDALQLASGGTWTQSVSQLVPGDYRITLNGRRAPDNYNFTIAEPSGCEQTPPPVDGPDGGVAGDGDTITPPAEVVQGSGSGVQSAAAVVVPAQAAPTQTVPAQTLPNTGSTTGIAFAIALALLAVGGGLVGTARRSLQPAHIRSR